MALEEEDRISSLPDCLLVEILSRLDDTKYAIRTGTLCKGWQHLWPQLSNLFFTHETNLNMYQFYSSLERILKTHTQVKKFKLDAFHYDETRVSDCIRNAINLNVQEVDFDLGTEFVLPDFFFTCSSFVHVRLSGCEFDRADIISWENLRTLHILEAFLEEDMIENILSGSPLLETLELSWCFGFERIDITTNKSVKNLGFFGYDDLDSKKTLYPKKKKIIQINAPYILSLAIKEYMYLQDLILLNVSSLINAELNYSKETFFPPVDIHEEQEINEEILKGHLLNIAHAKEVRIGKLCLETLARLKAKGFIIPSNVKVLGETASG